MAFSQLRTRHSTRMSAPPPPWGRERVRGRSRERVLGHTAAFASFPSTQIRKVSPQRSPFLKAKNSKMLCTMETMMVSASR